MLINFFSAFTDNFVHNYEKEHGNETIIVSIGQFFRSAIVVVGTFTKVNLLIDLLFSKLAGVKYLLSSGIPEFPTWTLRQILNVKLQVIC